VSPGEAGIYSDILLRLKLGAVWRNTNVYFDNQIRHKNILCMASSVGTTEIRGAAVGSPAYSYGGLRPNMHCGHNREH
jgi:hypothetical protein